MPEHYGLLEAVYEQFPDVLFLEFAYSDERSYRYASPLDSSHLLWRHEWHNTGRFIAYLLADPSIEYFYFCDGDEVSDGTRLRTWLESREFEDYDALRLACYWYFRAARYRATTTADMSLLIRKGAIDRASLWSEHERMGLYLHTEGRKKEQVKDERGIPFVHHYSWVRTEGEMCKKFASWGHFWERDWQGLIQEEYQRPFRGEDFIRHYAYEEAMAPFDPLLEQVPELLRGSLQEHIERVKEYPHVRRVSYEEMFREELNFIS